MREYDIQAEIRLALGRIPGLVLWRNNVGCARYGKAFVQYGLCKGSSDLIGIYNGRFIAGETKTLSGTERDDQILFRELVNARGGLAGVWRSVEDAKKMLEIP